MSVKQDELFFIIGTGRCGTTLLQAMLASHPRITIPPEMRYFGRHDPAVRFHDPLEDMDLASYLAACESDIWWQDMGMCRDAFEETVRSGTRSSRDIYLWLLQHVARKRGSVKPRIGEKTPYYALLTDRILELFPKAQFIHLYRDPRDVVASYLQQYWTLEGTALRCAGYVKHVFLCIQNLKDRVGSSQLCEVKYEQLVDSPEFELRRVCEFLGESYNDEMLCYTEREDRGYLPVEEEWKGMTQKELTRERIGRHESVLSPRQTWTVERMVGDFLDHYGYSSASESRISWHCRFWIERVYRKMLRITGRGLPLLDEQSVLARRNKLVEANIQ